MALQIRKFSTKLSGLITSEKIWKNIVNSEPSNIYKYRLELKNLTKRNDTKIKDCIYFPSPTFKSCPTDSLEKLISSSFKIVKEKNLVNDVDSYNSILRSYVTNNINFDADKLTKEMKDNKIEFNQETYSLLIEYYCNLGKMDIVESLIKEMKSHNEKIDLSSKIEIIKGYIIANQIEKSQKYVIENKINVKDPKISSALLIGFSSLGQIDIVMSIIERIKQKNIELSVDNYFQIYLRLARANVSDSNLEKILLTMPQPTFQEILKIILCLNRFELFGCSIKLLEKYKDKVIQGNLIYQLLQSYNSKHCPIEIYKQALTILLQFNFKHICCNLFANIDYNETMKFANNIINTNNSIHIATSLVYKTINEKLMDKIEKSLQYAKDKLNLKSFNMLLIINFIPLMLENRLALNCQELINLFPLFKDQILLASFIYCLINKDMDQLENLKSLNEYRNNFFIIKCNYLAHDIIKNYKSLEELEIFARHIASVFEPMFVNLLLGDIIIEKINNASINNNIDEIKDSLKLAKDFNVLFLRNRLDILMVKSKKYEKIFKCLFDRVLENKTKSK